MYPGQFPNIRLNIFNVVLVLDLSQTSALQFITGSISSIISRNFPFRFGVVPIMETEEGKSLCWILCDVIFIAYIFCLRVPDGEAFLLPHRKLWQNDNDDFSTKCMLYVQLFPLISSSIILRYRRRKPRRILSRPLLT